MKYEPNNQTIQGEPSKQKCANKLGLSWAKLKLSLKLELKFYSKLGVEIVIKLGVQLLVRMGGRVSGQVGLIFFILDCGVRYGFCFPMGVSKLKFFFLSNTHWKIIKYKLGLSWAKLSSSWD